MSRLTTSQFVTAPKPHLGQYALYGGLNTSQFVTAPKTTGRGARHP